MFTDEEALPWVKRKIQATTTLKAETNSELYGAMHVLCSDWHGMQQYIKAYKCEEKQGLIVNLSRGLQEAVDRLEGNGENCEELREVLRKADQVLGLQTGDSNAHREAV
jgi:hypothetical protein